MANASTNLTQAVASNITAVDLPILDKIIIGNTVREFIIAGLFLIGLVAAMKLVSYLTIKILEHIDKRRPTQAKEIVVRVLKALQLPLFIVIGLKIVASTINMPAIATTVLSYLMLLILTFYGIKVINAVIKQVSKKVIEKRVKEENDTDTNLMNFFTKTICGLVWIAGLLFLLSELGVDISKIFTGLGIAGIAVAFALQNILADIFASVSIYFDKPFKPGDYIKFNGEEGTIIKTGIKSTRIKLLAGDELIVSNKHLMDSKLENVDRMEQRRVAINLGIKYGTPKSKLEALPGMIEAIIKKHKKTVDFQRCQLRALKDWSIEYQVVYFVKNKDYELHLNIQQKIILDIIELMEQQEIEFAYPTQSVVLEDKKPIKLSRQVRQF